MTTQPLRILVINAHSVANAGDHVLLAATLDELRRVFPHSHIQIAMNDPAPIPAQPDVTVLPSLTTWFKHGADGRGAWRVLPLLLLPLIVLQIALFVWARRLHVDASALLCPEQRALLHAYASADLIVSSAGNFLYSNGRVGLPLLLAFGAIFLAFALDKPLYTMPQTLGPLATQGFAGRWQRAALRLLARRARVLQVRDEGSLQVLRAANASLARVTIAPDVALLFGAPRPNTRMAHQPPRLGITLVNWQAQASHFTMQAAYEAAIANAARWFVETLGGEVYLFAQVTGPLPADDDRVPARRVVSQFQDLGAAVTCLDLPLPAETLKVLYGQMDIFLGTRLHSTLFALSEHTPVAAIAYQPKTRGVFAMLELSAWVLEIEAAQGDAVRALLAELWQQRNAVSAQVATSLPHLRAQAKTAANHIRADYEQWRREPRA